MVTVLSKFGPYIRFSADRGLELLEAVYLCQVLTDGPYIVRSHDAEHGGSSFGQIMAEEFMYDLLDYGTSYSSRSVPDFQRNLLPNININSEGEDSRSLRNLSKLLR
jgi:hypothetical protein